MGPAQMPGSSRMRSGGFTIIELLIVMTIVGIIVAFAAPNVDPTRFRVNSAMQVLGSTMLTVQRQAITQQHDILVQFDTAQHRLSIHEDRDNDATVDAGEHVRSVQIGEGIVFGRGTAPAMAMGGRAVEIDRVVGGLPTLVFHRDGSASEPGGFYVTSLRESRTARYPQDARAVVISRATGRASWFRYRSDGWVKAF
ncbi:MAG: prepilin-type N-terminal cleavage/methylation domain-containing protein [Gemmatimonadetes bacterium]|nr:prepilin-type N-terminal cleavage/methylation domain-containing protein [Gemmatimonadota bacterium]